MSSMMHPGVVAVAATAVTYGYLAYEEKNRLKKHPDTKKRSISLVTPILVGLIAWFAASSYLGGKKGTATSLFSDKPSITMKPESESLVTAVQESIFMPDTEVFLDLGKTSNF